MDRRQRVFIITLMVLVVGDASPASDGGPTGSWLRDFASEKAFTQRMGHGSVVLEDLGVVVVYGGIRDAVFDLGPDAKARAEMVTAMDFATRQWFVPLVKGNGPENGRKHFLFQGPVRLQSGLDCIIVYGGQEALDGSQASEEVYLLHVIPPPNGSPITSISFQWEIIPHGGQGDKQRLGRGSCILGESLFLFGGLDLGPIDTTGSAERYLDDMVMVSNLTRSLSNATFDLKEPFTSRDHSTNLRPPGRHQHSLDCFPTRNQVILFGGTRYNYAENNQYQGNVEFLNDLWILDVGISPFKWEKVNFSQGSVPSPRGGHATAVVDGKLYLYGGHRIDREDERHLKLFNDLWVFDPSSRSWTELSTSTNTPEPRSWHSLNMLASSKQLLAIGGLVQLPGDNQDVMATVAHNADLLNFS